MANPFFNKNLGNNDFNLINRLEQRNIYDNGVEIEYLPRTVMNRDPILNEPLSSVFDEAIKLDAKVHGHDMFFAGNQSMNMNGFTFSFSSASLLVHREEFIRLTKLREPREGDLVFISANRMLFDIINVNAKDAVISGGRQFTFEIFVKPFTWSEGNVSFNKLNETNTSDPLIDIMKDMVGKVDQSEWDSSCKDDDKSMDDMKKNLGNQSMNKDFVCDTKDSIITDLNPFGFN